MQSEPRGSTENNFIALLNFIADPAVIVDAKGLFLVVNDAFVELTGLKKKELIGTPFFGLSVLSAENKAILVENLAKRMQGVNVEPYEIGFENRSGETRYAEVKAKKIDYAGHPADLVVFRDITRRKRNAKQLKEYSEKMAALVDEKAREIIEGKEKLEKIFDSSPDAIVVTDLNGLLIEVNEAAVKLYGCSSKDDLIGKNAFELIAQKEKQKLSMLVETILKDGAMNNVEYVFLTEDARELPVEVSASFLKDSADNPVGFVAVFKDISERKKAEVNLEKSEKEKSAVLDSMSELVSYQDLNHRVLWVNRKAAESVNMQVEQLKGRYCHEIWANSVNPCVACPIEEAIKKGQPQQGEITTPDGRIWSISGYPIRDEKGNFKNIVEVSTEITEKKKAENELKLERDKLEAVTENIGAGVGIISKDYRILWANKLLKQINGDCEGKKCYSTFNKLTDICPNCGVKKVFETGVPIDVHEYSSQDDKGNRFWIELIVTPIKDEEGNIIAALELAVNVTERKIMENKLAEYSQKLEKIVDKRTEQLKQTQAKLVKSERLATIGELAAMVGHDLRNPLTGIMGAAYYLKTKHTTDLGAKGKEMLETIEKAITYSNKIVNDLLEYSRDLKLDLEKTTPKELLENALSLIEVPEAIQVVDATEDKPTVKADMEKMRRVFVNIIKNAFDAMPEGGTLTVKSRKVKSNLEISFKDTGTGMSKETLSKLEGGVPLFTTKAKGMGFGVPICKRIAEAHGGKLSVESKIGKGTTITIAIPVNPKPLGEGEEKWIFNESMLQTITARQKAKQTRK